MVLRRLLHVGPIVALFVTFVCYCVAVIDSYLWLLPPQSSKSGKLNLLVLSIWLGLILRNFFNAVFLGPGFIPLGWRPSDAKDQECLQYCQVCQGFKPPRAHHCRTCKRCVMKMDHHCPWINTCCGHKNHSNFLLFLLFAPVGCIHAAYVMVSTILYQLFWKADLYRYNPGITVAFSVSSFFMNIFALGLAFGTIIAVFVLFFQQVKVVVKNKTAIEQWITEKAQSRRNDKGEAEFVYPYDLGPRKNIKQIINWRCTPSGDGYNWPVVDGCTNFTLSLEQLKQKKEKRDRTVIFVGVAAYSGAWLPVSWGLRTCCCIPVSDEPRIPVAVGEKLEVSRGIKHWLYGNKLLTNKETNEGRRVRGWFPRLCVTRLNPSDNGSSPKKDQ